MSYDKAVDSAKLDAAMSATADMIKTKLNEQNKIIWDELTGFASAVSRISTGRVATGSITTTDEGKLTVSGIDFKPTIVSVFAVIDSFRSINTDAVNKFICAEYGERKTCLAQYGAFAANSDGSTYTIYRINDRSEYIEFTMTEDGFEMKSKNTSELKLDTTIAYYYIAMSDMGGGASNGDFTVTDDGNGNVIITLSGNVSVTDDGSGNVVIA